MKTTTETLPAEILAAIPEAENVPHVQRLVNNARAGHYANQSTVFDRPKEALLDHIVETADERLIPILRKVIRNNYTDQATTFSNHPYLGASPNHRFPPG